MSKLGTEEAEQIIRQYSDMIYRIAVHNLGNIADAEDILQDVCISLLTKCPKQRDPEHLKAWLIRVTINKCNIDTLFDQTHIADDMKVLETAMENEGQSVVETNSLEEKLLNSYVGKKYSSITLAYDNQNPDGCAIGIVGKSTVEPVPDDESLEAKAKQLDSIIGNTLYCTVTFDDGTAQKQSIHIGTTVTNFGTAHSESFNQLTEEEKALKDYTDVFVTYSITE